VIGEVEAAMMPAYLVEEVSESGRQNEHHWQPRQRSNRISLLEMRPKETVRAKRMPEAA
jgi:hypothetical protein